MKKIFNVMPIALGVLAFASCSENDNLGKEEIQLADNQIVATVEQVYDDADGLTRGAVAEFDAIGKKDFVWAKGDQAKVYAAKNWKTDIYTITETADNCTKGIFTSTENVALTDLAYGIYPASSKDANGHDVSVLVDEPRENLTVNLPCVISYDKIAKAYYGDATSETTGTAYRCDRPMFGFVVDQAIKYRYLTSALRVVVESALPASAKYLVVRSTATTDYLSGTFTADIKNISEEFFVDNTKGAEYALPDLKGSAGCKNWIAVDLTKAVSYDNNIYVPIPAQKYTGQLEVYLVNNTFDPASYDGTAFNSASQDDTSVNPTSPDDTDNPISSDDTAAPTTSPIVSCEFTSNKTGSTKQTINGTFLRQYDANKEFETTTIYTVGKIHGNATLTSSVETMKEVNDYLATLTVDRDMVINFTKPVCSVDKNVWGSDVKSHELIIPESWTASDKTVTLNFNGETNGILTSGTGHSVYGVTLEAGDMKTLEIKNKSSLKNVIINSANATNEITVDLKESANSLTTIGTKIKNVTVTAGKVEIKEDVNDAVVLTDNGATELTISGGIVGNLTPKTVTSVALKGGTVTNFLVPDATGELTINMSGTAKIGTIKTAAASSITKTREVKINTTDNAVITTVTPTTTGSGDGAKKLTFDITATISSTTTAAAADAQANIYTGSQLLKMNEYNTVGAVTLGANFVIADDANFTSLTLNNNTTILDGNKKSISGLKKALFSELSKPVKDLTLKNVAIEAETNDIGALANSLSIADNTEFENVVVEATKIGAAYTNDGKAQLVYNVGGIFGTVTNTSHATLNFKNCAVKVTDAIQGYFNLGGFIGLATGDTHSKLTVTFEKGTNKSNIAAFKKTFWTNAIDDNNCGKAGNFIGGIAGGAGGNEVVVTIGAAEQSFADFFAADTYNFSDAADKSTNASASKLEFARHLAGNNTGNAFVGLLGTKFSNGTKLACGQLIGFSEGQLGTITFFGKTKETTTISNAEKSISYAKAINCFKDNLDSNGNTIIEEEQE